MGALSSKDVVVRESGMTFKEDKVDDVELKILQIKDTNDIPKSLVEIISDGGLGEDIVLAEEVAPFDDLSLRDVESVWAKVFDVAESFAVNERQLRSILSVLSSSLGMSPNDLYIASNALFKRFDDPREPQGWIDILEVLSTLTLLADITTTEKIDLIFDCFDMSEDMRLDKEELTLSLKSTICGLAKVDKRFDVHEKESRESFLRNHGRFSRDSFPSDSELRMLSENIATEMLTFATNYKYHLKHGRRTSSAKRYRSAIDSSKENIDRSQFHKFCSIEAFAAHKIIDIFSKAEAKMEVDHLDSDDDLLLPQQRPTKSEMSPAAAGASSEPFGSLDGGGGDEFMAIKPWLGSIVAPSYYKDKANNGSAPPVQVTLDYVYGYNAQVKNSVHYTQSGSLVYAAAGLGVMFNPKTNKQSFVSTHSDDVVALALDPINQLVATGELGRRPKVVIWDVTAKPEIIGPDYSPPVVGIIEGCLSRSVSSLAFVGEKNGHLVSVDASTIYVHKFVRENGQWSDPLLVASSQNKSAIVSICNLPGNSLDVSFVTVGEKVIRFWTIDKKKLTAKKAILGKVGKIQEYLCVAHIQTGVVVGTKNGMLYLFSEKNLKTNIEKAHTKAVNVLHTFQDNRMLLSGGRDGKIKEWDSNSLTRKVPTRIWDLTSTSFIDSIFKRLMPSTVQSNKPKSPFTEDNNISMNKQQTLFSPITAVCMHADGKKLVVGTQASQILEIDATGEGEGQDENGILMKTQLVKGEANDALCGVLMNGHFVGELWGLSVHPHKNEFCTVGDDKTLRIWNMRDKKMERLKLLEGPARACCYSNNGTKIAIGMGNDSKKKNRTRKGKKEGQKEKGNKEAQKEKDNEGRVIVFNVEDFSYLKEIKSSKRWVSEIKFSPNDKTLAVGTHDSTIYLYDAANGFKPMKPFKKHSSYITHFDFSSDSKVLQSNDGAYELLFSNTKTGGQITSPSSVKDTEWATWSCTLGWPVQGIWPSNADGTDINMVDRSADDLLLATADDFGKLKVFRYPCTEKGNAFVECSGHSSHVTNVKFSSKSGTDPPGNGNKFSYLITAGGNDRCVLQWKVSQDGKDVRSGAGVKSSSGIPQDDDILLETNKLNITTNVSHDDFDFEIGGGDEFTAVKPWLGAIVPPTDFKGHVNTAAPDNVELELEWVHGYQAVLSRNSLRYVSEQSFVYPAAGLGVKMSPSSKVGGGYKQDFFVDHDDDVVSLAVSLDLKHVATGQMGKEPLICIWDAHTMENVATLKGFHRRAVTLLSFAGVGEDEKLMSVGDDNDHSIAVYSVQRAKAQGGVGTKPLCSAKSDKGKVLAGGFDTAYSPSSTAPFSMVTCGVKHIKFWSMQGSNLTCKKGLLSNGKLKGKPQDFLSYAWLKQEGVESRVIIGTASGELYIFKGNKIVDILPRGRTVTEKDAHKRAVYALCTSRSGSVVSGKKDGVIEVWDFSGDEPRKTDEFDMKKASELQYRVGMGIRSLCISPEEKRLLVGTRSCEIYEIKLEGSSPPQLGQGEHDGALVKGHFADELWGLAIHPKDDIFCTVGDDKTVRLWHMKTHKMIIAKELDTMARAVAFSPNGLFLAIGLGGRVGRGSQKGSGKMVVLRASDMKTLYEGQVAKDWVSDVKFSPDGQFLAVGAHDQTVHLFQFLPEQENGDGVKIKKLKPFKKHSSYITHIDFSADSQTLQSNCGAYELLFCDVRTAEQITSASSLKDTKWGTWTCTLGWPVQGIWPAAADGTDVNSVDRSKDENLLATGDDFGKVKLFKYPCAAAGASFLEYSGHSSHVTNVRWSGPKNYGSESCEFLFSTGGNDRCVMQWRKKDGEGESMHGKEIGSTTIDYPSMASINQSQFDDLLMEEGGGDEFMAVKPWLGAIVAPTNAPAENLKTPPVDLDLEWVYGYQGQTTRNNVRYNEDANIVYHTAAVGVVHSVKNKSQTFFVGHHDDDILSFAMSPDRRFVATGQIGKKPSVLVWDASTCKLLSRLDGFHKRGVPCISFSSDGSMLASIGDDDDHSVALWKDKGGAWISAERVATAKGDRNKALFACWSGKGGKTIVTGGKKHIKFWKISGRSLKAKKGQFGKKGKIQAITCGVPFGESGCIATGTECGDLYIWKCDGGTLAKIGHQHTKAIDCIYAGADNEENVLLTGGRDGKVVMWDNNYEALHVYDITSLNYILNPAPRSVCISPDGKAILLGTMGSDILEIDRHSVTEVRNVNDKEECIQNGHCAGELWGLAFHPHRNEICTVGDDRTVRVWDLDSQELMMVHKVDSYTRACAYSPCGSMIAIGMGGRLGKGKSKNEGEFIIFDAKDLSRTDGVFGKPQKSKSNKWISDIKFSPDGNLLAIGAHDTNIHLYDIDYDGEHPSEFKFKCSFKKHNSYITHLDFSGDSRYLQSNCGAYELLFSDTSNGEQITSASSLKDIDWHTRTCTLGWPVQGIWPEAADGTDINAVDYSSGRDLLATADDFGAVKLFNYPCLTKGASFVAGFGHSSHVTNVRFSKDGRNLVSCGGNDRAIFKWHVTPKSVIDQQ